MGVKHGVRQTLLWLGAGVVMQRLLQLVTFLCIGRALGVEGLGLFAQGQALAAMLTVLSTTGVRNLVARTIAASPGVARSAVRQAIAARLRLGIVLALLATTIAFATSTMPWFWTLWALQAVPAAFDLKSLLDAVGKTHREVLLESATSLTQFVLMIVWLTADGTQLWIPAAIVLACRGLYAVGAARSLPLLPDAEATVTLPIARAHGVALAQTMHELLSLADVLLVAQLFDDRVAGLYAIASRFAAAALLPSAQLARLLLPHSLRAATAGDAGRMLATALRVTLLGTLPMLAGGFVVAEGLCGLSGEAFVAAGQSLRLLLLAGCLQHVGWHCSHTLLGARRDRAYARGLAWPGVLHLVLLLSVTRVDADATSRATLAAAAAAIAQFAYASGGLLQMLPACAGQRLRLARAFGIAFATAAAALLPSLLLHGQLLLPVQLGCGAATAVLALWHSELRGRWRRMGDGLSAASGFRT